MEDRILLGAGALILILQAVLLYCAVHIRRKGLFFILYGCEAASIALSIHAACWYDGRPGVGAMPGLTYITEAFSCVMAAGIYFVLLAVSIAFGVILYRKRERPLSDAKS